MPVDSCRNRKTPTGVILASGTDALSITFARTRRLLYWIGSQRLGIGPVPGG